MTTWINSAEGTNGNNVATADATTGDNSWNTVSTVTGQTITYDNTFAAHGATSHKHANTTGGGAYLAWTSATMSAASTYYARFYVYWSTLPSASVRMMSFLDTTGATLRASVRTDTTNHIVIAGATGSTMLTSSTALTAGAWYRVEVKVIGAATTGGGCQLKIFQMDSTTALEDITSATTFDTGGSIGSARFGNATGAASQTLWMDDYAVSDSGFIGPVAFSGQTLHPASDVTTTGWVATGASGGVMATTLDEAVADDTDYVTSPGSPTTSVFETKLEAFSLPTTKTGWSVDYRLRSVNATSSTIVVGLYQGTTLIASETRTNVPSTFTNYTLYLTNTQVANITDGSDLRVRFTVTAA